MRTRIHFYIFLGFVAAVIGASAFLYLVNINAATVDVTGTVSGASATCGNGSRETGETCDGSDGSGNCYNNTCKSDCTCPTCGNSVIEAGEVCESNSDCTGGKVCQSCLCVSIPTGCVPSAVVCSTGPCVNGVQSVVCTNGCSVTTSSQSCSLPPVCGDGTVNPGEECDDHNTVSGDGCSSSCQLEVGCGNGVVNAGEQCDDNNVSSGDCCSSLCQNELLITNVSESPANTSAAIHWTTPCQVTNSSLEWGTTPAVTDGGVNGLSGGSYNYTITNLQPNTVYYYRITATSGSLSSQYNDSFLTSGGTENCTNGIDDDNDGFCDFPASTCTDGSTSGDPDCPCNANFSCTPGVCDANNEWTVTCADQASPKCQPDYQYTETCNVCPGVTCGTCQQLNEQTCTCEPTANCCGNGTCEPPSEDPYTCIGDCPATCLSDWNCGAWQPDPCPPGGVQTRSCFDNNACQIPINPPSTQQTCGGTCPGLTCGPDQTINISQCICVDIVPFCGNGVCETGENHATCEQDCVEPCTPSWTCLGWGECSGGLQHRECYDVNNCNLNIDRPPETLSCTPGCEVACNTCQNINVVTCSCQPKTPCCGNHSCENGETVWSCAADCGVPPEVTIALTSCLDGKDNDGDGFVDYPLDPGCAKPWDQSELNAAEVLASIQMLLGETIIDNPAVEAVNQTIATPALAATIAVNTFATFSFFNFATYIQYFFTQPFAFIFRRRRRKWGVVYNSLTKQPVDLAIVRLYGKDTNRLIQSRVTDRQGRFNFLVMPGVYTLTVTKPGFSFPTQYLKDKTEDVTYLDLYHGEDITVTDGRADITVNIPVDSQVKEQPAMRIIIVHYLRKLQYWLAFTAVPLAVVAAIISPGPLTFAMLGFHSLMFILFRRLGYQKPPKNWGIVYDKKTRKPLGRAIARIYDKQYNKLLETRVTDDHGRYAFLVDKNVYYVTAEKVGYQPVKTNEIDLVKKTQDTMVGMDIGLPRASEQLAAPEVSLEPPTPVVEKSPEPQPVGGVGREALEQLIKHKVEPTSPPVETPASTPIVEKPALPPVSEMPAPQPESGNAPEPQEKPTTPDEKPPTAPPKNIFG